MSFKNVQIYFFVLKVVFLAGPTNCKHNEPVSFKRNTVPSLKLMKDEAFLVHFAHAEERQKFCYFAKMFANLAYTDYNNDYVSTWHRVDETSEFSYAMHCPTLPTVYIVRYPLNPVLQITSVQPAIGHLEISSKIVVAKSVNLQESEDASRENDWTRLTLESRQHLCNAARQFVSPLHFLSHEVAAAQSYIFEDLESKTETHDAFLCPTLPQLYIRRGTSSKNLEMVRVPSLIEDYEFEIEETNPILMRSPNDQADFHATSSLTQLNPEDRKNLCAIARRHYAHSFAQDDDVREANLYSFLYRPEEPEVHNVTILCPALPPMYLRADDKISSQNKTKILITFVQTPADLYPYVLEIAISAYRNVEIDEDEKKQLENHSFSKLSKEGIWNLCSAAQKYILSEKGHSLNFTFAQNHGIFSKPKLLLVPGHVQDPQIYEFERLDKEWEKDVAIKCSEWPRMYIRGGQNMKIILMKYELK